MASLGSCWRPETLAMTDPGEWVKIQTFLFESVEIRARAAGIRNGDILHCLANRPQGVLLEDPLGVTHAIERPSAWFIGTLNMEASDREAPRTSEPRAPAGGRPRERT